MVGENYESTLAITSIDPSRRIGDDCRLNAQSIHHADWKNDISKRQTFVVVDPALHDCNGCFTNVTDNEIPRMTERGCPRKMWDIPDRNARRSLKPISKGPSPDPRIS